jgi:hypothetical protein
VPIEAFVADVEKTGAKCEKSRGNQLGKSRMKSDQTTLAAGYGAVAGLNARQLIRHISGKKILAMN